MEVTCSSRIARVAVYGRGAVVTRAVALPASLPEEAFDLVVPDVTLMCSAGTARASVTGSREVPTLRMRLVVPTTPNEAGPLTERVRALGFERERLETEYRQLTAQRQKIGAVTPEARIESRWRKIDPGARIEDALAACGVASELSAAIDARLLDLNDAREHNARERAAAELAERQGRTAERAGAGHPKREIVAHVARGDARGLSGLEVSYVVAAARWWPAYSVRLSDGARRAAWSLEAFVAQASGEDWSDVALSLCSASLVREVRLPELPSLRLGRSQPAPRRGYRPPPPGLDEMFAAYDASRPPPAPPLAAAAYGSPAEADEGHLERTRIVETRSAPLPAPSFGPPPPPQAPPPPGAPPPLSAPRSPMMASMPMPARAGALAKKAEPPAGGGGQAQGALQAASEDDDSLLQMREAPTSPGFGGSPQEIEPADAWLDFDALTMAKLDAGPTRGRLVLDTEGGGGGLGGAQTRATVAIERLGVPRAVDPNEARAEGFDVRYVARSTVDVPSNGRPHRVPVDQADGGATPRFVVVPREAASVYRETIAKNPFRFALLAGPIDLFEGDALLMTTSLEPTGPGGTIVLGLGVEERVRVARNARTEEGTGGILGGTTTVDHVVSVDLTSSLGTAVAVEVLERLPETDDKDIAVELRAAHPAPVRYDQSDRGNPIRGGLRWTIPLPPAGMQRLEYAYRVTLPAKSEIVGGNRRE